MDGLIYIHDSDTVILCTEEGWSVLSYNQGS